MHTWHIPERLRDLKITSSPVVWLGAEDAYKPSEELKEFFTCQDVDGIQNQYHIDRVDGLRRFIESEQRPGQMGFVAQFMFPYPHNLRCDAGGNVTWREQGDYCVKVFHRTELSECYEAAIAWANSVHQELINEARQTKSTPKEICR